jgi:hypothetical protein
MELQAMVVGQRLMYTVDITKPPVPPPDRTFTFFNRETAESKRRTKEWNRYLLSYRQAMEQYKEEQQYD